MADAIQYCQVQFHAPWPRQRRIPVFYEWSSVSNSNWGAWSWCTTYIWYETIQAMPTIAYSTASKVLAMIGRTMTYKSLDVLLRLYKSLVRPHLEFCISVWSPYYSEDKHLLERVQHRFTRMIPDLKQLSYERRLEHLGLRSLEERRNRADLL